MNDLDRLDAALKIIEEALDGDYLNPAPNDLEKRAQELLWQPDQPGEAPHV